MSGCTKLDNRAFWNTIWPFLGYVLLGMVAGLLPVSHDLLAHGNPESRAEESGEYLAANIAQTSGQAQAGNAFEAGWRYTKNGWQNRTSWEKPAPIKKPALHPFVVGALQLLLCLTILIGFSVKRQRLKADNN